MPDQEKTTRRSRDSISNTLIVSVGLSLVASVLVAGTAIVLKPVQEENEERYRQQIILDVAGLYEPGANVAAVFEENIETRVVNIETGEYTDEVSAEGFDAIVAAKDPFAGISIPEDVDVGNIRQRPRHSPVYLVRDGDAISQIILPVYGSGLWSTMFGFLSLAPDGNTILGLRFYEHAETPGLGDQIDKPAWRAQWVGKELYGESGQPAVEVVRGQVDESSPRAIHQVDGISGATLTGRGVENLLHYWAGPHGFGPYLENVRSEASGDD